MRGTWFSCLCSAFFSSAETALFSLNPIQVHRMRRTHPAAGGSHRAPAGHARRRLLSTILIGNTLVNVAARRWASSVADSLLPAHGEAVAIPVMTLLLLVFGEVAPKRLAMSTPERLAAALLACPGRPDPRR